MTGVKVSGRPGNQLERVIASTNTEGVDYMLAFRRPHVAIDALTYIVGASQTGTLFTYGGQSCGITITLPKPDVGLWFEFSATGAIATAVTVMKTQGSTPGFVIAGDSAGADALTIGTEATGCAATTAEFGKGGLHLEVIGISTSKWLAKQWSGGASVAAVQRWSASS